jgi:hypothetical protein
MLIRTLCATTMLITAAAADAGAVMESVVRDLSGGAPQETPMTTFAQAGMMRVDMKADGNAMIFKNDVFYTIDTKGKTYIAMDRASMKQMADQLAPMMKQMQEQMARMPPEQRAQMEKLMGGNTPGMGKAKTRTVRKTSRAGQAGGYACSYVEIVEDGVVESEMCIAPAGKLSGGQEFMDAALKMGTMLKDMLSSMQGLQQMVHENAALFDQLGGIPVLTRDFANGKSVSETAIKSLKSEAIPATMFEIPAGYTKRDLMPGR